MLIVAFALLQAASPEPATETKEWVWADCVGGRALALSVSPDPAGTVVDAAFAVCHEQEAGAKAEKLASAIQMFLEDGTATSVDQATRLARMAETEGWPVVVSEMRGLATAVIVQARANAARGR